jgi:RHS repeat-associated protein
VLTCGCRLKNRYRKCCVGVYRYGFNGKEKDSDGEWGDQTHYDYGFRIYNPAIAKFLSVDPLTKSYPMLTPYQYASNRPIDGIDLDGLEYDDSKVKFLVDQGKSQINITGEISVKIKIVNLSSGVVSRDAMNFHSRKSSRAFDIDYRHINTGVPLDPLTSKPPSGSNNVYNVYVDDLDIDFEFIKVTKDLSSLKTDDIVLLLVDEIPHNGEIEVAGLAMPGGNFYAIEIDEFNLKNNIDTHEKGHLIGDMSDWKKSGGTKPGFLMSYEDNGKGYKLRKSDYENLIDAIIYQRAIDSISEESNRSMETQANDFINNNEMETNGGG